MIKHLYIKYKPFGFLCLIIAYLTLAGCSQSFPQTSTALAQRPAQWATPLNKNMNLFEIAPGLYRSQQPTEEDTAQIEALGIKTIINLRGFHSDEDIIKNTDITLVRIPIHTWRIRDEHVIHALKAIEEARKRGPVLIHCQHGADRTGLVSAMYRIIYQGWSKEEAWAELENGGYGYHSIWLNIPRYIRNVDSDAIKKALEQ